MRRVRGLLLAVFLPIVLLTIAAQAGAQERVGLYETEGCPAHAPRWAIEYDLYWSGPSGATLDQAYRASVLAAAKSFAQDVGTLSECAARVIVDVIDQPGSYPHALPSRTTGGYFPLVPARYDATFARVPVTVAALPGLYSGITDPPKASSIFPIAPGTNGYGNSMQDGNPWRMLLMHEWLHSVVGYYRPAQGWPIDDVHGACARSDYDEPIFEGIQNFGCMINPGWFGDLMTGRVSEGGRLRGLTKEEWARQGTPAHPGPWTPAPNPLQPTPAPAPALPPTSVVSGSQLASRSVAGLLSVRARGGRLVLRARGALVGRRATVRFANGPVTVRRMTVRLGMVRTVRIPAWPARRGMRRAQVTVASFSRGRLSYSGLSQRVRLSP